MMKAEPIEITRPTDRTVTLSRHKAATLAGKVIDILKAAAGVPYNEGETEEITFGATTWFLTLEER